MLLLCIVSDIQRKIPIKFLCIEKYNLLKCTCNVQRMINVKRNYRFSAGCRKLDVVHKENSATVSNKIIQNKIYRSYNHHHVKYMRLISSIYWRDILLKLSQRKIFFFIYFINKKLLTENRTTIHQENADTGSFLQICFKRQINISSMIRSFAIKL